MNRAGLAYGLVLATALALTGCGNTLVFVDRTGVNLSIIAKPSEATPLEVNFGLDRKVASVVPPVGQDTSQTPADGNPSTCSPALTPAMT
jgi:hypothetical protein